MLYNTDEPGGNYAKQKWFHYKKTNGSWVPWCTPVIPVTRETEAERLWVWDQPWQVSVILPQNKNENQLGMYISGKASLGSIQSTDKKKRKKKKEDEMLYHFPYLKYLEQSNSQK